MSQLASSFECQYNISLAVHYHMRRQQFYEAYHRFTGVFSLILSTSAVALIAGKTEYGLYLAAGVAILQCIDLILDTRCKGDLHNGLRRDYPTVNNELIGYGDQLSNEDLISIGRKINTIEMGEPPTRKLLLEICHNDAARNLGCDNDELFDINWFKANTANFINWPSSVPNQ